MSGESRIVRQGKNIQMASIICCLWCAVWEVTDCNVLRLSSRSICIYRTAVGLTLVKFRLLRARVMARSGTHNGNYFKVRCIEKEGKQDTSNESLGQALYSILYKSCLHASAHALCLYPFNRVHRNEQ